MPAIERPRLAVHHNDGRIESRETGLQPGQYECVEPLNAFVDLVRGLPVENRSSVTLGAAVVDFIDAAFRSEQTRMPVRIDRD